MASKNLTAQRVGVRGVVWFEIGASRTRLSHGSTRPGGDLVCLSFLDDADEVGAVGKVTVVHE